MEYNIKLSENDVLFFEEETGNIIIDCDKLPSDVKEGNIVTIAFEDNAEGISHKYTFIDCDTENNVATLELLKKESVLVEAPQITLDPEDLNNPDSIDFKKIVARETEKERIAKEAEAKSAKEQELKTKYANDIEQFNNSVDSHEPVLDSLELLFDALVPDRGSAETVAGELIRAIMRILYRDYNDGDKFFAGYGLETCGSSAEYLFDQGFENSINNILEDAYRLADDDTAYTAAINTLAGEVVNRIREDNSLIWTPNDTDSRDYINDYIEEHQPRYNLEVPGSDDLVALVEKGVLTSWDLVDYVEYILSYESVYDGAAVSRPWGHHDTSVTVENLTKEGYEYLEDSTRRNLEGFWEDLVSEHADELKNDSDDWYDDDYEEDNE